MPDEPDEIDWAALLASTTNLAEMVWGYYAGLVASGFGEAAALQIAIAYQGTLLSHLRQN